MYISQQIAAIAISNVLAGRNLTLALPDALNAYPAATPQQRGAASDLSYGTLRFYGEVNAYLVKLLEKPLTNTHITALLLVAIYQLLHDKADDFTVVNQAVKAAGDAKPRWAKSLVNGVLRNFLRQKDQLAIALKQDEVAIYSYPQWWIAKLKTQYPDHWAHILHTGNTHPPMSLRVNIQKTSAKQYVQFLIPQDIEAEQVGEYAVILQLPIPVEKIPGFADGVVSVQDYGAQMAAVLLDLAPNMQVLDACCAPGGKTGHILELAGAHLIGVQLTALDNDINRLSRVESNLQRLALSAKLLTADAATFASPQLFDRILADVPCTASGIVRRHVDIKWLRRESDIASFCKQQAAILANLWQLLAKGGKLLYVTCSIFNEENQQQIDTFLKKHTDAIQLPLSLTIERENNIQQSNGQLIPNNHHDGLFYALLQKT